MIDPKTLHIGSHVMVNGVRARVIRIDEPKDEHEIPPCTLLRFKAFSNGKWYDCGSPADSGKVEPIPITAELLTELGFEKEIIDAWNPKTRYVDAEYAKLKASGEKLIVPRITIQYINVTNPFWSVSAYGENMEDNKMAVRYLHELEAFLYLTTKTELIKE